LKRIDSPVKKYLTTANDGKRGGKLNKAATCKDFLQVGRWIRCATVFQLFQKLEVKLASEGTIRKFRIVQKEAEEFEKMARQLERKDRRKRK